jgi:hypothetical protein
MKSELFLHPTLGPCYEPAPFDIYDDDLIHDLCQGTKIAKPVQALLITLEQIETTNGCFGANDSLAMKALLPILKKLREAVKDEWRDDQ